jgi:hypothetical protein
MKVNISENDKNYYICPMTKQKTELCTIFIKDYYNMII